MSKNTIFINDVRHQVEEDSLTGAAIKALGDIPPGNVLFLEVPGPNPDRKIEDAETVAIHSGLKFYDLPPTIRGIER